MKDSPRKASAAAVAAVGETTGDDDDDADAIHKKTERLLISAPLWDPDAPSREP